MPENKTAHREETATEGRLNASTEDSRPTALLKIVASRGAVMTG